MHANFIRPMPTTAALDAYDVSTAPCREDYREGDEDQPGDGETDAEELDPGADLSRACVRLEVVSGAVGRGQDREQKPVLDKIQQACQYDGAGDDAR